jgi:hypothetical protein
MARCLYRDIRMGRPRKEPEKPATVSVRLLCILSGEEQSWDAGSVIDVARDEAERLISIGAAEAA